MSTFGSGTTGNEIQQAAAFQKEFLHSGNGSVERYVIETDQKRSTRFVPALASRLLGKFPIFLPLACAFSALAKKFKQRRHAHLDFNPRGLLIQGFSSGMAHLRSVGNLFILWSRHSLSDLLTQIAVGASHASNRLTFWFALGGGSGSSFVLNLLETLHSVIHDRGRHLSPEVHLLGVLSPVAGAGTLTEKELCNETATVREIYALTAGGACFPQADRHDLRSPEAFDADVQTWLFHNTGIRGLDAPNLTGALGALQTLVFEDPGTSAVFHREAIDRKNAIATDEQVCASAGVYSLFCPDQEKELFFKQRFCQDVLEEALTPLGDTDRECRAFIRRNQLADDGRNPGLSLELLRRAFKGNSPLREKASGKAPSALTVARRLEAIKRHGEKIRRDAEPDFARLDSAQQDLSASLPALLRKEAILLAENRNPATTKAILAGLPAHVSQKSLDLEGEVARRLAKCEQYKRQTDQIQSDVVTHAEKGFFSRQREVLQYRSLPERSWELMVRQFRLESDVKLLEKTAAVQKEIEQQLEETARPVSVFVQNLAEAKSKYDSLVDTLLAADTSHRGHGLCLQPLAQFENEYQRSGVLEHFGPVAAAKIRNLLAKTLERNLPMPDAKTICGLLDAYADEVILCPVTNVEGVLLASDDLDGLLRAAIQQAEPLLAKDPTHDVAHEVFIVRTPSGGGSPLSDRIQALAREARCPQMPTFIQGPPNEVTFLRVELGIPLSAVMPLRRAEKVYRKASRQAQIRAHRMPVYWFLPSPIEEPSDMEVMRTLLMGVVAGLIKNIGENWSFVSKAGTAHDLKGPTPEALREVLGDYRRSVEARSWFICETLVRGFAWAASELKRIQKIREFHQGAWSKALLDLSADLAEIARMHHQSLEAGDAAQD